MLNLWVVYGSVDRGKEIAIVLMNHAVEKRHVFFDSPWTKILVLDKSYTVSQQKKSFIINTLESTGRLDRPQCIVQCCRIFDLEIMFNILNNYYLYE